jgi:hypothetical protein
VGGRDQVNTGQLTQGLTCDPERRLVQGEELFFFMMGDGVSAAAGAERPDVFSEMTALVRRGSESTEQYSCMVGL